MKSGGQSSLLKVTELSSWQKKLLGLVTTCYIRGNFLLVLLNLKKLNLLNDLENLDLIKEHRRLSTLEFKQEEDILLKLSNIRKQEEIYWKQRSRLQWLKGGDKNINFFHTLANGRKN